MGSVQDAYKGIERVFRCSCCGALFETYKPQNPDHDNGYGTCLSCQDRVVTRMVKDGWHDKPITYLAAWDRMNKYA